MTILVPVYIKIERLFLDLVSGFKKMSSPSLKRSTIVIDESQSTPSREKRPRIMPDLNTVDKDSNIYFYILAAPFCNVGTPQRNQILESVKKLVNVAKFLDDKCLLDFINGETSLIIKSVKRYLDKGGEYSLESLKIALGKMQTLLNIGEQHEAVKIAFSYLKGEHQQDPSVEKYSPFYRYSVYDNAVVFSYTLFSLLIGDLYYKDEKFVLVRRNSVTVTDVTVTAVETEIRKLLSGKFPKDDGMELTISTNMESKEIVIKFTAPLAKNVVLSLKRRSDFSEDGHYLLSGITHYVIPDTDMYKVPYLGFLVKYTDYKVYVKSGKISIVSNLDGGCVSLGNEDIKYCNDIRMRCIVYIGGWTNSKINIAACVAIFGEEETDKLIDYLKKKDRYRVGIFIENITKKLILRKWRDDPIDKNLVEGFPRLQ